MPGECLAWSVFTNVQSGLTSTILPRSLAGLQWEFAVPMVVSPHAEMYGLSTQLFSRINSLAVLLCFALQSAKALGSGQCCSGGLGFSSPHVPICPNPLSFSLMQIHFLILYWKEDYTIYFDHVPPSSDLPHLYPPNFMLSLSLFRKQNKHKHLNPTRAQKQKPKYTSKRLISQKKKVYKNTTEMVLC